jgi:hypothetical protein
MSKTTPSPTDWSACCNYLKIDIAFPAVGNSYYQEKLKNL